MRKNYNFSFSVIISVLFFVYLGCNNKQQENVLKNSLKEHEGNLERISIDTVIYVRKYKSKEKKILADKIQYNKEGNLNGEIISYNVTENPEFSVVKSIVNSKNGKLHSWSYRYHENGTIRRIAYYKNNKSVNNISVDGKGYIYNYNSSRTQEFNGNVLSYNLLDSLIRNDFPEEALFELNWMYIKLNY